MLRKLEEDLDCESEDEDTPVELGMTIDTKSPLSLSSDSDEETSSGGGESDPDDGESDLNNEEGGSDDVSPLSSRKKPDMSGMAGPPVHRITKESTANPLSSLPLKNSAKSDSKAKLELPFSSRKVRPKATPRRSLGYLTSSQPKTSVSIQPAIHAKFGLNPLGPTVPCADSPQENPGVQTPDSTAAKQEKCVGRPTALESLPSNETPVPSNTNPPPVDSPNPTQPKNTSKAASQPVEKSTPQEEAIREGPTDLADAANPLHPDAVVAAQDPSRVSEPVPDQSGAPVGSGNRPESSPAKSTPTQSTQNSFESNVESLYASPSPEKPTTDLMPIELDSDPDFEMMERMLFSHRGPSSSQSQSIKKEPAAQSQALSKAKRLPKRRLSHPSPHESSQAPTQTPQGDSKPAKRLRVDGPRSPNLVASNDRRKHPEFWDLDGTVVLQVDDVLFRVMRSSLGKASPWFQRLFSEELDHLEIIAGCPVYIIEGDLNHLDFANLLRGLENGL